MATPKPLSKYFKSKASIITITYGKEEISFDLVEETRIDENTLFDQMTEQPSHYAFLGAIAAKVARKRDDQEVELKRVRGEAYLQCIEESKRAMPKEEIIAFIDSDEAVIEATKLFNKYKEQALAIFNAVRAFEQRADILRSLNSIKNKQYE